MLLEIARIYQDIIQDDKDELVQVVAQEIVHHVHELGGGISKPKWHYHVLEKSPPRRKCCLVNVSKLIGICQYPNLRLILLNTLALPNRSNISSGKGRGYLFLTVFLLSHW